MREASPGPALRSHATSADAPCTSRNWSESAPGTWNDCQVEPPSVERSTAPACPLIHTTLPSGLLIACSRALVPVVSSVTVWAGTVNGNTSIRARGRRVIVFSSGISDKLARLSPNRVAFCNPMLLILLVVLGYLAARFAVDWLARHALVVAGAEYLILGLLMGPRGTGLLTPERLRDLAPFFTLAIGWMGVSVGFRFWLPLLTRTPGVLYRLAFIQSLFTAALVGGASWLIIWRSDMLGPLEAALPATLLGAIAVASSLQGARIAARSLGHRNLAVRLLEVASGLDALIAITMLSVALAIFHQPVGAPVREPTPTEWVVIALAVGVVGGWL